MNTLDTLTEYLLQHARTVTCAESCTGGLLAAEFTRTSGSSAWFDMGFVTYSNAAKADYALSISGIAGPGGGSEEKPVGTVWFGLADKQHIWARQAHFGGSRSEVRAQAVQFALAFLLEKVQEAAAA